MEGTDAEGLEWLSDYLVSALKSPTWVVPIAEFVDDNCNIFDSSEENKLEYTICHNNFRLLIDDLFMAHLLDVSVSPAQFDAFCMHGLASRGSLHRILVEQLLSVDDFLTFKAMMVKRNVDLDRKAALEMNRDLSTAAGEALVGMPGPGELLLSLIHSDPTVSYAQWPIAEGVLAWHDREFGYTGIPEEIVGATLFAGPHKAVPKGFLHLSSSHEARVYLFYENAGLRRDGGFPKRLRYLPEWVKVSGTQMKWGRHKGKDFWISVWSRSLAAGTTIEIQISEEWVGGVAVKPDTGEWRLYEEQEQLMRAISGADGAADSSATCSGQPEAGTLAEEIDQRYEQAQLEQAIALSLQAEEERLRQISTIGEEATAAAAAPAAAPPEAPEEAEAPSEVPAESLSAETVSPAPLGEPPMAPLEPAPLETPAPAYVEPVAAEPAAALPLAEPLVAAVVATPEPLAAEPLAAPATAEAPAAAEAAEVSPRKLQAPKELPPVMPRMVRLQPLVAAPLAASLLGPGMSGDGGAGLAQLQAEAVLKRERAAAAAAAPAAAAPPPVAAPTEEERRARAEHLKRQREALLQKRKAEREQQLRDYASRGTNSAAVDRAMGAMSGIGAGGVAVADLTVGAAPGPDTAEAAVKMRQALTLQLRQTLEHGKSDEQISKLEQMKRG